VNAAVEQALIRNIERLRQLRADARSELATGGPRPGGGQSPV
jgi:hypothetical protein